MREFSCQTFSTDELIRAGDNTLFRQMSNQSHPLPASTPSNTEKQSIKLSQELWPQPPTPTN